MLADSIAKLIEEMLENGGGQLELKRNEMANQLGCVPSQISYVITSRFTPERGYIIESRRGGGGYVRIVRKDMARDNYLMHCVFALGESIDERSAAAFLTSLYDRGFIDDSVRTAMIAAVSSAALTKVPPSYKNSIRADIIRQFVLSLMK